MKILFAPEKPSRPPSRDVLPVATGLLAAAATAYGLAEVRFPSGLPLPVVAAVQILCVAGAGVLGVRAAGAVLERDVEGVAGTLTGYAAWFAPLFVYLHARSWYAVPIAAFIVACVLPRFCSFEDGGVAFDRTSMLERGEIFHLITPSSRLPRLSLVGAAACVQAGVLSATTGEVLEGVVLVTAGAAIVTWRMAPAATLLKSTSSNVQFASSALTLLIALVLTAAGVGAGAGHRHDTALPSLDNGFGGKYWGVFLWSPAPGREPPLVTPSQWNDRRPVESGKLHLRIPFDGVYWLFQSPDLRPPSDAISMSGSPADRGFLSTDSEALLMEAHQTLTGRIGLESCERIEMAVRDADQDPETVSIELVLIDSAFPNVELSLGAVPAGSFVRRVSKSVRHETLTFTLPEHPVITGFDEMKVRFHTDPSRETISARIAIEDFVLIPR